nr:unnamed protein product [Digitaria exilis]
MDGKGSAVALKASPSAAAMSRGLRGGANPLEEWKARVKGIEAEFRAWMAKQPIHIEAAVTTAVGAVQGAALGGLMGSLAPDGGSPFPMPQPPPNANPQAMASLKQAQALAGGPLVQARNFAVMTGANAGLSCVMRRIRGQEDIQGSMAAAFGSGALFSIVSGMGTPNPKFSKPSSEDTYYSRTRSMLHKLGLEKYEKNFKKGLLTDQTLPLLTDRDPELVQTK